MAAGSLPFPQRGSLLSDRILNVRPPSPRQSTPTLAPGLEAVIMRCLEKDPDARFRSGNELLTELTRVAGGQASSTVASGLTPPQLRTRKKIWASVGAVVLLIAMALGFLLWRTPKAEAHQKIMAVLPFDLVGQSSATSALGAGLMETVAAKLGEAGNNDAVEVIAPHELREKGVKSATDARREFGTDMVLEGSLQQSGQELRVTCNLVDSRTGRQLGARTVTRDVNDIFSLQDDTVSAVLDILHAARIKVQARQPATRPQTLPAAYAAYMRGRGYLQEYEKPENIENAVAEFQRAISIDPGYALAYADLGIAYWREYQRLDKGSEWVAKASDNCQRALSLNSQLTEAHICLGTVLNGSGKYERAAEEFKQAVALNRESDEALSGLADAYTNMGNFAAAEDTYKRAMALRPNYWGIYSELGLFYYSRARYPEAAAMLIKATQLAPDNYEPYLTLGGIYVTEGRYQDAIEAFKRSIDLRANSDAYNNLGYAYILLHQYPQAIEALEKALKIDAGHWEYWGNLGDALYWSSGRRGESVAAYQKAISIGQANLLVNPRDGQLLIYMADYSAMLGEQQLSLSFLEKALEASPSDPEVFFRAAAVRNHFNQTELAIDYLKKAVSLGYSQANIRDCPDFGDLQSNPQFKALVTQH